MKAHPIANIFPPMTADDFERLKADIEANGLREPVWVFDGQILDGRHRYQACAELGIEPELRTYDGTEEQAHAFSLSLNLGRRHMTTEQKAWLGVQLLAAEGEKARERMSLGGQGGAEGREKFPTLRASEAAAEKVGTNRKYVESARSIRDAQPDVFERMSRGEYGSMSTALGVASLQERYRALVHEMMDAGRTPKRALENAREQKRIDIEAQLRPQQQPQSTPRPEQQQAQEPKARPRVKTSSPIVDKLRPPKVDLRESPEASKRLLDEWIERAEDFEAKWRTAQRRLAEKDGELHQLRRRIASQSMTSTAGGSDLLEAVGFNRSTTAEELRRARNTLTHAIHPDKEQDPEKRAALEQLQAMVNGLFGYLKGVV